MATIAGHAYSMHLLDEKPIIIDDVEAVERHHATRYWVEKHGIYEVKNLDKALALYRNEAEISTESIVIDTNQMCMWMNDDVHTDDLRYSGVVKDFLIDSFSLLGVTFHCYYVGITFQG